MDPKELKFDKNGLIPAILQHVLTREVLMLGYMNSESLQKSIETGHCWFFSRSRARLWEKGESSGHFQVIESIAYDCDKDTLLLQVTPQGPTCHTGTQSCFDGAISTGELSNSSPTLYAALERLQVVVHQRNIERPADSYTTHLFEKGIGQIAKKFGEEGVEVALAAVSEEDDRLVSETADLLYNLTVLFEQREINLEEVGKVLLERAK
ncbi:MAG: bifunctional phosphoribosyl-AMP cyclohydrolase/phosphoribosyl-ATP diphosphatase HisIE [Calditrichaeota bacterium]|nr:MAG: bifunctional phosphoribosyl-AMP cyclohydrolase/phosphoribosyl-ATP diphosphatase HisIE [Calditrichota bacterium]